MLMSQPSRHLPAALPAGARRTRRGTRVRRGDHAALLPGESALQPQGSQLQAAGDADR